MVSEEVVEEIRQLLGEDGWSQRRIAEHLGVSRGLIGLVASGKRGSHGRETALGVETESKRPGRCPCCGDRVKLPCVACRARDYVRRRNELRNCHDVDARECHDRRRVA